MEANEPKKEVKSSQTEAWLALVASLHDVTSGTERRADPNHNYYAKPHANRGRGRARGKSPHTQRSPDRSRGAERSRARGRGSHSRQVKASETATDAAATPAMTVESLHLTLDQLNGLHFPNIDMDPADAGRVIATLTTAVTRVTPCPAALALKWCQSTVAIMRKHEVYFETAELLHVIECHVTLLRAALDSNHVLAAALLRALSFVLYENSARYQHAVAELLALLLPLVDFEKHVTDREVSRLSATCLGSIAAKSGPKPSDALREIIATLLRAVTATRTLLSRDVSVARSLAAVLHALALAVAEGRTPNTNPALPPPPSLIGALVRLTGLGTVDKPDTSALGPAPSTVSDSEQSDSEAGDRYQFWKVRLHALNVLQSLVRAAGVAQFVQYWPQFLPASPTSPPPHLCAIISTDPAHKVRAAAIQLLQLMLDGSAKYLVIADDSQSNVAKSFTPLSRTLGAIVRTLHHALLATLATEQRANTLLQLLKCFSVVIDNMPYDRLSKNIIVQVVQGLEHVIFKAHEDAAIRASAVTCLTHVLNTKTALSEVQRILTAPDTQLAARLTGLLASDTVPPQLTAELFRAFAAMCTNYYQAVKLVWPVLLSHTLTAVKSAEVSVRIAAVTLLDGVAKSVAKSSDATHYWTELMTSAVTDLFQDEINAVRATICNCFSQVPARVFDQLARDKRIMMQTVMLGLARDEAPLVRATASRTLGVYITFKSLSSDALFVADVALVLTSGLKDKNLNVRIRASWGLGNLCDALIGVSEDSTEPAALEDIPTDILVNVIACAVRATRDNDKVRANAVRALGNFLRFAPLELLRAQESLVCAVFATLMQHTGEGSVKVRWNACYALGNAFHSRAMHGLTLQLRTRDRPLAEQIAGTLAHVLRSASNFKVRINAAAAVAQLQSRDSFGEQLTAVWRALVDTTAAIDASDDPASYQYKNTLQDQLLSTLQHVIAVTGPEDVAALRELFAEHAATLCATLHLNCELSKHSPLPAEQQRAQSLHASHTRLLALLAPLDLAALSHVPALSPL